jgi:hypothetical protein
MSFLFVLCIIFERLLLSFAREFLGVCVCVCVCVNRAKVFKYLIYQELISEIFEFAI